jgi:hypothetical protein
VSAVVRLQIGLVGEHARHVPNQSAFGLAARLASANHFSPGDYFSGLGLRLRREEDLSQVLTFSDARKRALASALAIARPTTWDLVQWLPFELRQARVEEAWKFRYCPACLRGGFHTLFFQLPWVHRCPWHSQQLRTACTRCERPMMSGMHQGRLLHCACGHAAIDVVRALTPCPELDARRSCFLAEYCAWAATERSQVTVLAPASGHADWRRLAHSVRLPPHLSDRCQDAVAAPILIDAERVVRMAPGWSERIVLEAMHEVSKDDPGVMELPTCMVPGFDAAARNVALALPPGSLTDREVSLFFPGLGGSQARQFNPARHEASMGLVHVPTPRVGGRSYLHLHTIAPTVLRSAWGVLQESVGGGLVGHVPVNTKYAAVAAVVATRLLTRGYVEGMRAILARHVPALLDHPRLRPRYSEPWVWVRRDLAELRWGVFWSPEPLVD